MKPNALKMPFPNRYNVSMKFLKANIGNLDEIWSVVNEARVRLGSLGIDQWQGVNPKKSSIEQDLMGGNGRIVTKGGKIVGYAMVAPDGEPTYDEINGSWLTDGNSEHPSYIAIHRVAVADKAARSGVGRFMLAKAEDEAAALARKSVRIDTHEGNIAMKSLLASIGYTKCGTILLPEDYGEPTRERVGYEKLVEVDATLA